MYGESEELESTALKATPNVARANKAPLIIVITDCKFTVGVA
jgi:hypothetical protein